MDRDTFIITVYCLVDEEFKKLRALDRVRHAGFAPALSDVEVLRWKSVANTSNSRPIKTSSATLCSIIVTSFPHIPSDLVVTNEPQMWRAAQTLISCFYTAFGQRLVT